MLPINPTSVTAYIDGIFVGQQPWRISATTAVSVILGLWIWDVLNDTESIYEKSKKHVFRWVKKIPYVAERIRVEGEKVAKAFENEMAQNCKHLPYCLDLPETGVDPSEVLNSVKDHLAPVKYNWQKGFVSGTVYIHDEKLNDLMAEVVRIACYANPLHPDVFPGVCKMEAEIIKMTIALFHGTKDGCGVMTSGGTESIIMACKAYRDYAKETRGVKKPEIVLPRTAHAAFDKAGSYLGMQLKHIEVDYDTMKVNISEMKKAISKNTVMLVGSSPNFPYGTIDDIEEIGKLGLKYNIPVHVDCCLGSFVAAFMPEAGFKVPPFDFNVPGVTSMSVDTHKYGFAPKGTSLVLYSKPEYRRCQYYTSLSWPGGHYGSPAVSGSRSGAVIAECWATMKYFGREGYIEATRKIVSVSRYIEEGLRQIPGIFVFGEPFSTVIAIGSKEFHIYKLCQTLSDQKKWNLNMLQFPFGFHICVTLLHTLPGVADQFLNDVKEAVEEILKNPNTDLSGKGAVYGMSATLPDRTLVGDFTKFYLDALFYTPKN